MLPAPTTPIPRSAVLPVDSDAPRDRRPIAARATGWAQWLADQLIRRGVPADAISAASVGFAVLAMAAMLLTSAAFSDGRTLLWIVAAVAIQLRLLCNLLDGMVAIGSGKSSPAGELWNDLPDRVSDSLILVGFGIAVGLPVVGLVAALLAMLTACVRLAGRAAGAASAWCGPMAKPHRMALLTAVSLAMAVPAVAAWQLPVRGLVDVEMVPALPGIALGLIAIGCVVTVVRRLQRITADLKRRAAGDRSGSPALSGVAPGVVERTENAEVAS